MFASFIVKNDIKQEIESKISILNKEIGKYNNGSKSCESVFREFMEKN